MRLRPLPRLDLRRKKALDHYFDEIERWWELSEQPRDAWRNERSSLDASRVGRPGRADLRDGYVSATAAAILDAGHARWFRTTEKECDDAEEHPHEASPDRRYLVSAHGVVAVVADTKPMPSLVTAFRPDPLDPDEPDFTAAAHNYVRRCAVRRVYRRTSCR